MFGTKFYFGSIRKYVALFGTLFNDISIDRVDPKTGQVKTTINVPLSYGPRERYLSRIRENPDLLREINQILPRMAFEIKSVEYDSDRKLNTVGKNKHVISGNNGNSLYSQYNPVPYNFNIDLSILTRNADDATRIVEQILPFFKPEWTTTINLIPEMNIKMDIPVVLRNVQYNDTYEGNYNDRYAVIWDLQFVLKGYIYGPIRTSAVIKEVDVNFYTPTTDTAAEGVGVSSVAEYIKVFPGLDVNGNPTSNQSLSVPSSQIPANSNYGYITDFFTNIT
jgi:hypothetical protein